LKIHNYAQEIPIKPPNQPEAEVLAQGIPSIKISNYLQIQANYLMTLVSSLNSYGFVA